MNYTEMLFNRYERLISLLNQADSKNLELIEEINNREDEIERLNNIIEEQDKELELERKSRQLLTDDLANVCGMLLKKESIIKEVREYIEKHSSEPKTSVYGLPKLKVFNGDVYELIEILEKEDKNGDNK